MWMTVATLSLACLPVPAGDTIGSQAGTTDDAGEAKPQPLASGPWRAWLDSPGGDLPFWLDLRPGPDGIKGWLITGSERVQAPGVLRKGDELVIDIDHYDAKIRAKISRDGKRLDGHWTKRRGPDAWLKMAFHATAGVSPLFDLEKRKPSSRDMFRLDGRWAVNFAGSDDPAVGVFETFHQGSASGTFMTTTGDYRYLSGRFNGKVLRLSCFDGAHAFLFHATAQPDGTLKGDFWSGNKWHDTWTAVLDEKAELPDAFAQSKWTGKTPLAKVKFPDLDGKLRSLDDPAFRGKARLIVIFGSWCPNCHDEGELLRKLHEQYGDRGLSILGLAFELTGDHTRDAQQVRKYLARHDVSYPVLIAGVADKEKASKAFPLLDRIRSYPTTIFMDAEGKVRAVHTGFTGPATGDRYHELWIKFQSLIEELLAEAKF